LNSPFSLKASPLLLTMFDGDGKKAFGVNSENDDEKKDKKK
jgi:hypothetical protein